MKIEVIGLDTLPILFHDIPRYSYTNVLHFEVKGEWLYFGVSGWAFGFRDRIALMEPAPEDMAFSLVTDEFLRDLSGNFTKPVELDINPTMKNVFRVINGVPRTYNMVSMSFSKFVPSDGKEFEVTSLMEWEAVVSEDPMELLTVNGGQGYINNPLSVDAPIFRINEVEEVENFSTSALLLRLAPFVPVETPLTLTPTHVALQDKDRDVYVFTERYMENPYYTSKSLLFGLLMSAGGKAGLPLPEEFTTASLTTSGPLGLLWDEGEFSATTLSGQTLYSGVYAEPEGESTSQRVWVGLPDLHRALIACGTNPVVSLTTTANRTAILVRGTKGAALLPLKEYS